MARAEEEETERDITLLVDRKRAVYLGGKQIANFVSLLRWMVCAALKAGPLDRRKSQC